MNFAQIINFLKSPLCLMLISGISVAIILMLIVYLYRKRKNIKIFDKSSKKVFFPGIFKNRKNFYKDYFLNYRKKLPFLLRHTIHNKKQFLYFNTTDNDFILKSTEAERFNYTYVPEYENDKPYNYYILGDSFISEIKKEIILDNNSEHLKKLYKFWKKFYSHQTPEVLISVDYKQLISSDEKKYSEVNLAIRKKINSLIQIFGKRFPIYLCIANMNELDGYDTLLKYFKSINLNYNIFNGTHEELENKFGDKVSAAYENISSLIKTNDNAFSSVSAIGIIHILKTMSRKISSWIDYLMYEDGIMSSAKIDGIILEGYNKENNIFELLYSKPKLKYLGRYIVFSFLTLIIAFFLIKTVIADYELKQNVAANISINYQDQQMDSIESATDNILRSISAIKAGKTKMNENIINTIFSPDLILASEKHKVSEAIYTHILYSFLKQTNNAEKTLFTIFLIKSNASKTLKEYIEKNKEKWSVELNINQKIISYFLENSNNNDYLEKFSGNPAYTGSSSFSYFRNQYQYLINFYNQLCSDENVNLNRINSFLEYYYRFYNKKIILNMLINKFYPGINNSLSQSVRKFIKQYSDYINKADIENDDNENIMGSIDVFKLANYNVPSNIGNFSELMSILDKISNNALPSITDNKTLIVGSSKEPIKKRTWKQTVILAKINTILEKFYSNESAQKDLISDSNKKMFLPIYLNEGNNGNFMFTGKYEVPGIYSKIAVESVLVPNVKNYRKLLEKLQHIGVKTRLFEYKFNQMINKYVDNYKDEYENLINNFSYEVDSPVKLNVFLNYMSSPESPLLKLIEVVKENTDFKICKDNSFIKPVKNEFKAYAQILESPKKNSLESNRMELYFNILQQASGELEKTKYRSKSSKRADFELMQLEKKLSRLGKISLNIIMNNKSSYINIINNWLDNLNMPVNLRAPFIKPVSVLYTFGKKNLNLQLNKVWDDEMIGKIRMVQDYFPFSNTSSKTISPDLLTSVFSPGGKFWSTFNQYYKPFLEKSSSGWKNKNVPFTEPIISDKRLAMINKVYQFTNNLWDKDSNPKPLEILVMASELHGKKINDHSLLKMAYLNTDDQIVYGINSAPVWRIVKLKWWQKTISYVGIKMSDGSSFSTGEKQNYFAFYKLLNKSKHIDKSDLFTWKVNVIGSKKSSYNVDFYIKSNPWGFFEI